MIAPLDGQCLCGAIAYRVNAEPRTVYACHCTDCQRRTGSAFAVSVIVPRSSVELLRGEPVGYFAKLPDGRTKAGRMCAACGTRLWGEPVKRPELAIVQPGTLDDPSKVQPVAHQFTRSAQRWVPLPRDVPLFEGQADPAELVRLWKAAHEGEAP